MRQRTAIGGMLKARYIFFGFALLIAAVGDSWSQEPSPSAAKPDSQSQTETKSNEQPSSNAQRGSEQAPFFMKIIGAEPKPQEGGANRSESDQNKPFDWGIIIQTIVLGIIGLMQFAAFVFQACYMRSAADEMRKTTTATIKSTTLMLERSQKVERAYMSGGGMRHKEFFDLSANGVARFRDTGEFEFHINNYGKTAGTLYKIGFGFCDEGAIPPVPTYQHEYRHNPIDPGRRSEPIYLHKIPTEHKTPVVYGRFYYETIFGTRHSSGFIYRILPNVAPESIKPPSPDYTKDQDEDS